MLLFLPASLSSFKGSKVVSLLLSILSFKVGLPASKVEAGGGGENPEEAEEGRAARVGDAKEGEGGKSWIPRDGAV